MSEWHQTETFKSLIALCVEVLKMLALANGGAAVACLTYLGNLASRSPPIFVPLKPALVSFSVGLFVTVLAFLAAYVTQLKLYQETLRGAVRQGHRVGVVIGIILALVAAAAFGVGCYQAADALI
jgi:hypothetical protein